MTDFYGLIAVGMLLALILPSLVVRKRKARRGAARPDQDTSIGAIFAEMTFRMNEMQIELAEIRRENEALRQKQGMGPPPPHDFDEFMAQGMNTKFREHNALEAAKTVLGVTAPWTEVDLKTAYRARVKIFHPDQGGTEEEFLALQAAYDALKPYSTPAGKTTH